MKHIIILGDGMADRPIERLGGKTILEYARKPYMDMLAREGKTGRLLTIPDGFSTGSEVANTSILGYDLRDVYEGRGPLEAASAGYEMRENDLALRCNIVTLGEDLMINHHGGHLTTPEGKLLIDYMNEKLGDETVSFVPGVQYRHLIIIKGGNKHVVCTPPHDHPNEPWRQLMARPETGWDDKNDGERMTGQETADLINGLILKSQELLETHPLNIKRRLKDKKSTFSIWPWGGGYRPSMRTLGDTFLQIRSGSVISAVDLIKGIGYYAGLNIIEVEGATGLHDTNYEGKTEAALKALKIEDFVFLHVEASDEAGHDGDLDLKIKTVEDLDSRVIGPIFEEVRTWKDAPVCVAILPDHLTPVETRTHAEGPVPFIIWHPGIQPDGVKAYDEHSCANGGYGLLRGNEFMRELMKIQ